MVNGTLAFSGYRRTGREGLGIASHGYYIFAKLIEVINERKTWAWVDLVVTGLQSWHKNPGVYEVT